MLPDECFGLYETGILAYSACESDLLVCHVSSRKDRLPGIIPQHFHNLLMTHFVGIGFIIAALSSISWALADITRKQIVSKIHATSAVVGLMLTQALFLLPFLLATELGIAPQTDNRFAQLLFIEFPTITSTYVLYAGVSVLMNLAAHWLFLRAVFVSPLSLTAPYLALSPVFSAIVAFAFLGQTIPFWGIVGILVVCGGAFFLNPGEGSDGALAPLKALWSERGSLYMVGVALFWSITPVLDIQSAQMTSPLWHAGVLALGEGLVVATYLLARGKGKEMIADLRVMPLFVVFSGLLLLGGMVFQLSAYEFVQIAHVETMKRAFGVVLAMLASMIFFGEKDIARRSVAAGVMVAGVALVLLSGS